MFIDRAYLPIDCAALHLCTFRVFVALRLCALLHIFISISSVVFVCIYCFFRLRRRMRFLSTKSKSAPMDAQKFMYYQQL